MPYFEKHQWSPTLCRSAAEVDDFLTSASIKGLKIKDVFAIGVAENLLPGEPERTVYDILSQAGVPSDVIHSGSYPWRDHVQFPCEVKLCEPVVLLLENGSTLAMQTADRSGIFLAVDQIPAGLTEGTNHSNVDASVFFESLKGRTISEVCVISETTELHYPKAFLDDVDSDTIFCFSLIANKAAGQSSTHNVSFYLRTTWEGWFWFGICERFYPRVKPIGIDYAKALRAIRNPEQITIVEGHDGSSYFWIMPVRRARAHEESEEGLFCRFEEKISIEEMDVSDYLADTLERFFEEDVQLEGLRDISDGKGFAWYLTHNLYTYDTVRTMLKEWQNIAETPDCSELARDFYLRFIRRMEAMLEHAPDCEWISFMGP